MKIRTEGKQELDIELNVIPCAGTLTSLLSRGHNP